MAVVLAPFLWYVREAEEAARFYASVIPNSRVERVTVLPADSPSGPVGSVVVVDFILAGRPVMAMTAGEHHAFNDAISLILLCDTQDEIDALWHGLLRDGGQPVACGWLKDRFGVSWQVAPRFFGDMFSDPDREKAARAAKAMMTMVKFDLAALQAAFEGRG